MSTTLEAKTLLVRNEVRKNKHWYSKCQGEWRVALAEVVARLYLSVASLVGEHEAVPAQT